jgi:hypothetical protein
VGELAIVHRDQDINLTLGISLIAHLSRLIISHKLRAIEDGVTLLVNL